jgi:flagellar basal-body rod protein FlgB
MNGIFDSGSMTVEQKSLDALWLRQQVISGNIANIDTPGYKSKSVQFEGLLERELKRDASGESLSGIADNIKPRIVTDQSTQAREDGNNVDIDAENVSLVRTQLQYEYMVRSVADELSRLKYAITEGRG